MGRTPLHRAVELGFYAMVELLLEKGAPMNVTDKKGNTPLHQAALSGRSGILLLLLKGSAKFFSTKKEKEEFFSMENKEGDTLLHCAYRYGHYKVVKHLKEFHYEVFFALSLINKKSKFGQATPGSEALAKFLMDNGADYQGTIKDSSWNSNDETVANPEPSAPADNQDELDAQLLSASDRETIRSLLEQKASIEVADSNGRTPLIRAAMRDDVPTVILLLKYGARKEAIDTDGRNFLHHVSQEKRQSVECVIKLLFP